jgi:hypothetical protein
VPLRPRSLIAQIQRSRDRPYIHLEGRRDGSQSGPSDILIALLGSASRKRSMTMGDVHKIPLPNGICPQFLSSDDFHPEFGYLCPTPRMRIKLRMIAILASIGMMIGAILVLAPVHRDGSESDRRELALSAAAAVPTADETPAMKLPSSTVVTIAPGALRAPASCQDLLGSFVNHQCESGKSREARSRRGAPHRIVSLPIGRSGAVFAAEPTVRMPQPITATSEKGEAIANVADITSTPGLPDPFASHTKSAHKHKQPTARRDTGLSAFAAAPWFGSNANNRKATPFRSGGWGAWR